MKVRIYSLITDIFGPAVLHALHRTYRYMKPVQVPPNEQRYIENAIQLVANGGTALDIGANVGIWTSALSRKVGPEGKVLVFEPLPESYRFIKRKYGGRANVQTFNLALSNSQGRKSILIDGVFFAPPTAAIPDTASHIRDTTGLKEVIISTDRLDDVLREAQISKVDFMKIDVEGHEQQVLEGARRTLTESRPILVMEILREKWLQSDPSKSPSASILLGMGYRMGQFGEEEIIFDPAKFTVKSENFIFLPPASQA